MQSSREIGIHFAEALNRDCHCVSVDQDALKKSLLASLGRAGLAEPFTDVHSHLFSSSPVFLWPEHVRAMQSVISAVERVAQNSRYRDKVLGSAPPVTRHPTGTLGVYFGYDFHLSADGPRLVEINTNAGGALLNAYLAAAQQACCAAVKKILVDDFSIASYESTTVAMFRNEFRAQFPGRELRTIAIVDNDPTQQFLYPEFLLFQAMFERHGINAVIAAPGQLAIADGELRIDNSRIDLVYNRLTDFYLEQAGSAVLLEAYRKDMAAITPSPCHYALYADKRNLTLLSDRDQLEAFGVDEDTVSTLVRHVPKTIAVTADTAETLWKDRKNFFFKPNSGFGSRGAYRGARISRKVWQSIVAGNYVAQAVVAPSERQVVIDGETRALKLDIRCVTYDSEIQQLSARLYEGQTTNMRTRGGGLATVFPAPESLCC